MPNYNSEDCIRFRGYITETKQACDRMGDLLEEAYMVLLRAEQGRIPPLEPEHYQMLFQAYNNRRQAIIDAFSQLPGG